MHLEFFKRLLNIYSPDIAVKFNIKKTDIFLVSYPKSGNTWLRFLLGNYISNDIVDFAKLYLIIPDIDHNPEQINQINTSPRFIKSHFTYTSEYPNVIYIIRDGRDVAVSYYYYLILLNRIDKNIDFQTYFYDYFMKGRSKFGSWGEHIISWKNAKKNNMLFIKYEDMLTHTEKVFRQIIQFSNMHSDDEKVKKAIQTSSFKSMQNTESLSSDFLVEKFNFQASNYGFVRKGVSGDWINHFDKKMLTAFNSKYSTLMDELGYK